MLAPHVFSIEMSKTMQGRFPNPISNLLLAIILLSSVRLMVAAQKQERALTVVQTSGETLDGKGKLWAVVVGVSSYSKLTKDQQLQFAHRDAQDFAAFLRSPNGGGFPANQITLL